MDSPGQRNPIGEPATLCRFPRFSRPVANTNGVRSQLASARVTVEHAEKLVSLSNSETDPNALGAALCGAWALLLRCFTGQNDVSFGFYPCGDDPCNVLLARFVLDDPTTISEMLGNAKTETTAAKTRANFSVDTAIIMWGTFNPSTKNIHKLHDVNLRLLVKRGPRAVGLFLEWSSNFLGMPLAQGKLVASTLGTILSSLLAHSPDTRIGTLNFVGGANLDQVLTWNNSICTTPVERCIHDVIADMACEHPDSEAVCAWDGSLTYRDLDVTASLLAARLVKLGVGPEVLVPLCFEKSKFTVVAMLAVLKAGGAFVPLDPSHPAERLRHLCGSVDARLVLCSRKYVEVAAAILDNVLAVDDATLAESEDSSVMTSTVACTNAAYVIFTSGSTGNPKGTVIEHRAFCSSASAHAPALRIDGGCRVLQFAAHTFDASLVEILTPLMVGGCICIPDDQERLDNLAGAINRMRVNHAVLTPSFVGFLSPSAVPGLRRLVLAGEAMATSHVATWSHIELVNGYGPAESSVAAVCNSKVGADTEPTDIGVPCGVRVWLVDAADHNRLVPVGCVGEMLLEGPSLARGYLHDKAKTDEAFIFDPAWAGQTGQLRRFYKTGDLARYSSVSGSLTYVGRKDTQIKFHGQRIELGEIEHHLAADENIQHGMVILPKTGPLKGRIVAVVSLPDLLEAESANTETLKLSRDAQLVGPVMKQVRARLSTLLPAYMVPSVWLCVDAVPMLASRKMNRKAVSTWVENSITAEECQQIITDHQSTEATAPSEDTPLTPIGAQLLQIWSVVLNLPAEKIDLDNHSFLSLGGDSITAMACASRGSKCQLDVKVQDILRAKSIRQLARAVKTMDNNVQTVAEREELDADEPFELSPIQQLHFQTRGRAEGDQHFNQSFCLRITRHVTQEAVKSAIEVMVKRHAMLRARFVLNNDDGRWRQLITADIASSYRFASHDVASETDLDAGIASAQECLDILHGPVFAAELFEIAGSQQIVFMTAHHLVVDLVSWRILLDEMEEILENPSHAGFSQSLSFRKWAALQRDDCVGKQFSSLLPVQVPTAQFDYWGMDNQQPNLYGDVVCQGFEVDAATTATLLSACHGPFRTETVDLLLAALMWSFSSTFRDRPPPAVYNEGHGREPPSDRIDISRTVGWFTTLFPVALTSPTTLVDALIQTKDLRKRAPGNGRPYFAARFHDADGVARWAYHAAMEIAFNFLGRYQQLERADALFQPAAILAGEAHRGSPTADFGHAAHRFALFEISAVIVQGVLRFSFAWNKSMRHQERIREWLAACRQALVDAASALPGLDRRATLSDFPLLPGLTPDDLCDFEKTLLPNLTSGRGWLGVEDVYPASPIQQGLLVSRSKNRHVYAVQRAFRVRFHGGERAVDAIRLAEAWHGVIQHHASLRTVFVDAIRKATAGGFDQVVLNQIEPAIAIHEFHDEGEIHGLIAAMERMQYMADRPQHRFSIFHQGQDVFCVLEIGHAIMDGASMDILLRDLGRAYTGRLEDTPKPLFSPFVASLQERDVQKDIAFWTNYLADMEPCRFPSLNDGVEVPETARELRSLRVTIPNLQSLQDFCDRMSYTLPNAFTAAWAVVLSCYTGTGDVCFGYLVSGRDDATIEGSEVAVGPFINMATQRVRVSSEENTMSLLQVIEAVQEDQLDCMPYAQTSLAEIQHALKIPGGMALFDTCISYRRRLSSNDAGSDSILCEDLEAIHDPTEYPISINVETTNDGEAFIDLDYWTDALAEPQAEHVAAVFVHTLSNMVEYPDTAISQLDHVPEPAKEAIWSWNANMPPTTADCIHWMVERQVKIRPQAQAIRGWDANFSYKEMDDLASRLAYHLGELGVGPEVLVPVCFDKSAWTVIAMLAVLKAGGGVVPLDASHPVQALEGKVIDSDAHIIVASESRASVFEPMAPYVVAAGPCLLSQLDPVDAKADAGVTPQNAAFVMFTSGSTGQPKGVVLCHQALVSSCLAHGSVLGVCPQTRFLQFAAHTFDNSIEEMFTTLIHGGCVCVPSEADRLSDLPGAINALDANFMDLTPTVAALLHPSQVPKIQGISVGGEALTQAVLDAWGGAIPVHNQYGPSECSINATHRLHTQSSGDVANIGTSVGSVSWVVDPRDHNRLVPIGCVGELLIEGPILARGYLNKPDVTAKAFIEMPQWALQDPQHGARGRRRMYKTGDLVRYNSDGSLIYLGRKDTQVKLHGQRIELGEIEHHLKASLPSTRQSAVELVTLEGSQKSLAAFIAPSPHSESESGLCILPTTSDFNSLAQTTAAILATNIASYMVPNVFFPISRMPLTSSGKLDRRSLRDMAQALSGDVLRAYRLGTKAANGRTPDTPMEKEIQRLWSTVLKLDVSSISADDSFFRHGGDSIGAMRLAAAARQQGIVLSVANIFQLPKLSDMAKAASAVSHTSSGTITGDPVAHEEALPGSTEQFSLVKSTGMKSLNSLRELAAEICRVESHDVEDLYPCTPLQAGLVATSQRQPGAFVAVNSYELPANTDITRFKKAWQEVADSEAILRTRVVFIEGYGFLQVVLRGTIEWDSVSTLSNIPESWCQLPQGDGGVLSRYVVVGEHTSRPCFTWIAHHALYDGWSLSTLLDRVESRYRRPEPPVAPVPHYSRFVEYLTNLDAQASDAFWMAKLADSDSAPRHFPQLPKPGYRAQTRAQAHRSVCFTRPKHAEFTTASFIRAAWALVLSVYSSSDDIIFCEVLNGRDAPVVGIENLVGPTFTSVPRRARINRSLPVGRALADLHTQFNDVMQHQFTGIQHIKTLGPAAAAACDFQNLLAIDSGEEITTDSLWSKLIRGGNSQSADFFSYPLNVACSVTPTAGHDLIEVRAHFDDGVVSPWLADRILGQFDTILERLSASAAQREKVGEIELLTPEDKAVIRSWNLIPGLTAHELVHRMVSKQMALQGSETTAVIGWDMTLSNGELDSLSDTLAHHLLSRGVGPRGSRFVPFCFEKSTLAIVAMLAILKAGAAFVPLDPSHPPSRLRRIIDDCDAGVILCSPKFEETCRDLVPIVVRVDRDTLDKLTAETQGQTPNITSQTCTPNDPAYIIFTSGTTGKPKGTIISHSAFCSGAVAHGPAMGMQPPFRFLQFASYTFDASLVEIFTTLMMGGTICVPRDEDRTNGNIASFMEQTGVTMTLLTPSFARTIQPTDVPGLKTLILGGEAMSQSHLDQWADKVTLINAYGPSECAVVAAVKPGMRPDSNSSNLGRGIGRSWIVDPHNHNRLAPVGSVGELLVEGPILSTGYLRNETKTRDAFIESPRWALDADLGYPDVTGSHRRMYKTGDLVCVADDVSGEMIYMGRKDSSQAKINGQRLELDEISHHLDADDAVRHSVILFPKTGPCANRLVAALVLSRDLSDKVQISSTEFQLVVSSKASSMIEPVKERLRDKVPIYMVPSLWIVLANIPLLPSGKLNRLGVVKFVESMSDGTLEQITAQLSIGDDSSRDTAASSADTSIDEQLKTIWSEVLNIPLSRIGRNLSFLHLGGDSINAMQVMARCRSQGIQVTVRDIIDSKSVHQLAFKVAAPGAPQRISIANEDHYEFDPSPIQQLYFDVTHNTTGAAARQFNQSVLLRLRKGIGPDDFARGLHVLVGTHSMLRARFRRDGAGNWRQRITTEIGGSYRYKTHTVGSMSRMERRIQASQQALDIEKGPLLAADCFTVGKETKDTYAFIAVHHLVVDVVSWGILLQDMEDFFATGSVKAPLSMPFQAWSRSQSQRAQEEINGPGLIPHRETSDVDLEFWGMVNQPNVHGDVVTTAVELESETTTLLLDPELHVPLRTEPLDVLLAALLLAYRKLSPGRRGAPTIHNEGHGREPWDGQVDLSRTVGWFTTLYPVHLPHESSSDSDIVKASRWVGDYRRRLPGKGRPYFAYRLLTSRGREEYGRPGPVEVSFNYLGQMQTLARADTFLESVESATNSTSDIGKDVPRFALVEISARVLDGKMQVSVSYNKHMNHQDSLRSLANDYRLLLQEACQKLSQHRQEQPLQDFSLLPLTYYGLDNLRHRLQDVGVSLENVEDVYPCSPMQRGLLLSQLRDPEKYAYRAVFQLDSTRGEVDLEQLCIAWQRVVERHETMRTIFIDTVGDEGLMDQVVLRVAPARIKLLDSDSYDGALSVLSSLKPINHNEKKPPHRLSICKSSSGHIFCQLEVSHAISDGSSMPILLDDLSKAYGGSIAVDSVPLYRDYMAYIQSQPRGESVRYWKDYLSGAESCLFPALTDGRTETENSLGAHIISLEDVAKINAYCASSSITLSTFLQLVWGLVVRIYTGSDQVLFGYLASGRDIPVENIERAVGAFINMLVCRLDLPRDAELGDVIDTMKMDFSEAMKHQICSLAEIQHGLQLPGTALFNTAFTYQKRTQTRGTKGRQALQYRILSAEDPSEYAVAVNVEAADKTVEVHFSYWRNMVSDAQMRNISAVFVQTVEDMISDPRDDRTVGEVDVLGHSGIKQLLQWNNLSPPRVDRCVHDLIAEHARELPASTPAVCGWDVSFTYRELNDAADALAYHLVTLGGVGSDMFVPLCFEKSAWAVVAQLAVLKSGAAFVSLDPDHPDSRLRELIQDTDSKFVVSSPKHRARMGIITKRLIVVDRDSISSMMASPRPPVASSATSSNAAYVIFTSGTTGKPKGTVIEHGAFCTGALAHAQAMFMHRNSRVLQFASYTFDASIMETLSCLLVGGCVCVPSDEEKMNDLGAVIRNMGVTWTLLTPSVASTVKPESVPGLRTLVTGGEAMSAGHIARWGTRCALVNAYGPTECSVVATTSTKVDESRRACNTDSSNIGTAVGGRIWVVDAEDPNRLVPVGAVGELVVEGRHVARGYLKRPEQTAKAFIQAPAWAKHPAFPASLFANGDRMYRTGDLVRYNSDGSVSYIARKDTQIKLNGRRIELGEIEFHCRASLPEDAQAAVEIVVPPNSRNNTKSLAVFFSINIPTDGTNTCFSPLPMSGELFEIASTMESHVSGQLPAYMVPQIFVPVSVMPWTTAGKLDRRQLRQAVENASRETLLAYKLSKSTISMKQRTPTNPVEKRLQELWATVLGLPVDSVGVNDNFFRLGGDSLTAMRLVGAARAHRFKLSVLDVFENPILANMANACGGLEVPLQEASSQPFELLSKSQLEVDSLLRGVADQCQLLPDQICDIYPCSPLQEALFALANKQAGAYVAVNMLELLENTDLDRFKAAWQAVSDTTDTLRSRILHTPESGFLQVVTASRPIHWHEESSLEDAVARGRTLGSQNGGELTRYALVRGRSGRPSHFVWAIHHALYDGWSLPKIAKRVQYAYDGSLTEDNAATARVPYSSFIRYLGSRSASDSGEFWKQYLEKTSSVTHFPQLSTITDTESPLFRAETCQVEINRSNFVVDVTIPTLIRAAWAIITAAYTGADDVVFGETLSGRNIDVAGVEDIAGPTFTTVPTRVRVSREMNVSQFLMDIHKLASQMAPHQHMGLQHIKQLSRDCAAACAFQNIITIQSFSPGRYDQPDEWKFEGGSSAESFFTHPLVLECTIVGNTIKVTIHHDERVLSSWHAQRLATQLRSTLYQLIHESKDKQATLARIHVISPEDHLLIQEWNNRPGTSENKVNACIHDLFLRRASRHPQRPGINAWDAQLSYGEIRDYATRLAHHLQQIGVQQGSLVPICVTRSAWAIVGLLSILMAGCAFIPFDAAHPVARQKEMLDSLSAEVMICGPEHVSRFAPLVDTCVVVDGDWIRRLPVSPDTSELSSSPDDRAYILFTSGSTGRPKGVIATHGAFCSSSRGYALATNMTETSRVLHFASLTFDVALMEVLTPLTLGASVCVPTEEARLHDLGTAITGLAATWAFLTPSVANLLDPREISTTLKTLVCGGEAMVEETVARWADHVELMNGYGPTEACVLAIVNPDVSREKDRSVIGRAHPAADAWVLEPSNDGGNWLAPVGAVGELAISGPLLAQGYLHDPAKTAQVFIENPPWAEAVSGSLGPPSRVYRTGDLVRYRHDGALEFLGRRDGQVKVNGQRIELGEIESRLSADNRVQLASVVQPKTGPCENQLVAVVTLAMGCPDTDASVSLPVESGSTSGCKPAIGPPEWLNYARADVAAVRSKISDTLPHYMVPTVWIVLESMPVVVSGKLDRQGVLRWLSGLNDESYTSIVRRFMPPEDDGEDFEITESAKILRAVWTEELRLPLERIDISRAFLSLGGDSIRAMGIVSRARRAGLSVSVRDVLGSKSVVHLAQLAKRLASPTVSNVPADFENEDLFSLSPIQNMYFGLSERYVAGARFNQSIAISLPRKITVDAIKSSIHLLVGRHSMLRARFSSNQNGEWAQRTIKNNDSAYGFFTHRLHSQQEVARAVADAQCSLSIEKGPIFRVDVFNTDDDGRTIVSMIAHHLCVDMVSWRVILSDLTDLLEKGALGHQPPLPFKSWCSIQSNHVRSLTTTTRLPFTEAEPDFDYWGAREHPVYGTTEMESFTLDAGMTKLALSGCHRAFRSEPVDLFLAAVAHSFFRTFKDRDLPILYNETHGREALEDLDIDLSHTIGWFTSICPLAISVHDDDILHTVRKAKDVRRSIPGNGTPFFAGKFLGTSNKALSPMEILFNYLGGGVESRDQSGGLIQSVELGDAESTADVGPDTRRMALFEISAAVINNQLHFSFIYDKTLDRAQQVRSWISSCRHTLLEMIQGLIQQSPEPTLADYPLLPLTYGSLRALVSTALPRVGVKAPEVEDIYPCTPIQEGMLISQLRDPSAYIYHAVFKVHSRANSSCPDPNRLACAWRKIVNRHAALRTIFIESVHRGGIFDQLVLKKGDCSISRIRCRTEEIMGKLEQINIHTATSRAQQLPHHLAICSTQDGQVIIKLEANHAAMDGGSLGIILEELASEYAGALDNDQGPLYSNYIRYIRSLPTHEDTIYWKQYLNGARPCLFPKLNTEASRPPTRHLRSMPLRFEHFAELRHLSERTHITLANIMHAAWALVLSNYTGSDDVCFGYLVADRDAPVTNIHRTVGTLINMLCCRVQLTKPQYTEELLEAVHHRHLQSMQFQRCSLARVQHELGLGGKHLYNTSVSIQSSRRGEEVGDKDGIWFELEEGYDPSEYAITLNIDVAPGDEGVVFRYWSDHLTESQAQQISSSMAVILDGFITKPAQLADHFDSATDQTVDSIQRANPTRPLSLATEKDSPSPTGDRGKVLANIWRTLLNLPPDFVLGGEDSFFDLGGDSIIAMKLVGEARDQGLALTVADVFRFPSFDEMVANAQGSATPTSTRSSSGDQTTLQGATTRSSSSDSVYEKFSLLAASNIDAYLQTNIVPQVGVFRGGIADVLPATDFQSLAVTGALLTSRWMLNYFYLDGHGPLDVGRLRRACFSLVQGLDILRTVFVPSGGRFLQVILRTLKPAFHVVDLDDQSVEDFTEGLLSKENAPQLGEPLTSFTVVQHRASQHHRILLRISHAQYDGVCFPRILRFLQAAYRGDPIPPTPTFANYLRASAGGLTTDHYRHWKRLLEGSSMTEIVRRDKPNYHESAVGTTTCLKRVVTLPPVESGHITTATVVKAAWAYTLAQVSGRSDVVFGHTISGRNGAVEGVENMMGPCLNLVPVRVQFGGQAPTARELLRQVQDQQVANMPHEVLGFREIIHHCTNWPNWTYFTSTVQHQNIDQNPLLRLGGVDYQVGCAAAALGDFADVSILSQSSPSGVQDEYELMLSVAKDGPIPRQFAERTLDLLSETATLFAAKPDTGLPPSDELLNRPQQLPFVEVSTSPKSLPSVSLKHLHVIQERHLFAHVTSIWSQALGLDHRHVVGADATEPKIDLNTSFFSLGGDMVTLGQVALLLSQESLSGPSLEHFADNPTVQGHMEILASLLGVKRVVAASTGVTSSSEISSAAMSVVRKASKEDSPLTRAVKLVKRIGRKRVEVAV